MEIQKIEKTATTQAAALSEEDLALINRQTLREMTAEEVYTFKLLVCDNQVDRDGEVFTVQCLKEMANLLTGKTVLLDHIPIANNQTARIYKTEIVEDAAHSSDTGEIYTFLRAYCYMPRSARTEALIEQIEAGIRKECSIGCAIGKVTCSVCGADGRRCEHIPLKEYDGKQCYFKLESPKDAYEVSFVAVPAQRHAGVTKSLQAKKTPNTVSIFDRLKNKTRKDESNNGDEK